MVHYIFSSNFIYVCDSLIRLLAWHIGLPCPAPTSCLDHAVGTLAFGAQANVRDQGLDRSASEAHHTKAVAQARPGENASKTAKTWTKDMLKR